MFFKAKLNQLSLILSVFISLFPVAVVASKCLFVSSYHQGYEWADSVEKGFISTIKNHCEIKKFNMNTKHNNNKAFKQNIALKAKQLIEDWKPDIVITADDNAAKYLIQPYYKDHKIPFVFCGINWSIEEYGFPFSNTTGMVEIAPIKPLFKKIESIQGKVNSVFYIGVNNLTEKKDFNQFVQFTEKKNIKIDSGLVSTMTEWMLMYEKAQQHDVVVIGSTVGIQDWIPEKVKSHILRNTKKLSVTNHGWMMPFTALGLINIPEEQGQWAARAALHILKGTRPDEIPIVTNRKWDLWINEEILEQSKINLPRNILEKGKRVYNK